MHEVEETQKSIITVKSEPTGKLINTCRTPGLISILPGSALRKHVESLGKPRILEVLPCKPDIKIPSPSFLYAST